MKERPILFSAPMVRAILEGRKTQTRRKMKSQPYTLRTEGFGYPTKAGGFVSLQSEHCLNECPYGKPSDQLRVKEAAWVWCRKAPNGLTKTGRQKFRYLPHGSREVRYVADRPTKPERANYAEPEMVWRYKTGRFMPRWASRIVLEITEVRVQRLNEISKEDAEAEGLIKLPATGRYVINKGDQYFGGASHNAVELYRELWDSINGYGSWAANPWVWAITFKVVPRG